MEKTINLTSGLVSQLLRKVVNEAGADHVDPNAANGSVCEYTSSDSNGGNLVPECIVGRIMVEAGVPVEALARCSGDAEDLIHYLIDDLEIDLTVSRDARILLLTAQSLQDQGLKWGPIRNALDNVYFTLLSGLED